MCHRRIAEIKLVEMYSEALNFARSLSSNEDTAKDIVQEATLRALKNIGQLKDLSSIKSWFFMIVKRESYRTFSSKHSNLVLLDESNLDSNYVIENDLISKRLYQYFIGLEDKYSTVMILFFIMGYSSKEISQMTGENQRTIVTRIFRAKKILKKKLMNDVSMLRKFE